MSHIEDERYEVTAAEYFGCCNPSGDDYPVACSERACGFEAYDVGPKFIGFEPPRAPTSDYIEVVDIPF